MADERIKRVTRSLVGRVVVICLSLLVLPLLLYVLLFYRQDYEERVTQARANLLLLARERARSIGELLEIKWRLLETSTPGSTTPLGPVLTHEGGQLVYEEGMRLLFLDPEAQALYPVYLTKQGALTLATPYNAILAPEGDVVFQFGIARTRLSASVALDGLTLTASLPEEPLTALHLRKTLSQLAAFLVLLGAVGGGLVFGLTRRIARPLRALSNAMARVSAGATDVRFIPDRFGFEINALGLQWNEMIESLFRSQEEAKRQRTAREKLAEELRIGQEIQKSLLSPIPPVAGLDIGAGFLPAQEVSGDLYDLFLLPDGQLLIVIADAAGKGISACLFALTLRSALRANALHLTDLASLLEKVNRLLLLDTVSSSFFITAWVGVYNPHTRTLVYASQGHPHALLRKTNGTISELSTGGMALGIQEMKIETATISLATGDLLLLYTDGLVEAHGYGLARVKLLLPRAAMLSSGQVADLYLDEVRRFAGNRPLHDDVALVVLRTR